MTISSGRVFGEAGVIVLAITERLQLENLADWHSSRCFHKLGREKRLKFPNQNVECRRLSIVSWVQQWGQVCHWNLVVVLWALVKLKGWSNMSNCTWLSCNSGLSPNAVFLPNNSCLQGRKWWMAGGGKYWEGWGLVETFPSTWALLKVSLESCSLLASVPFVDDLLRRNQQLTLQVACLNQELTQLKRLEETVALLHESQR